MKLSQFNVVAPSFFEGTTLLYNSLTGSFLSLAEAPFQEVVSILERVAETGDPFTVEGQELATTLVEAGFIVPEEIDERAVVRARYRQSAATQGISLTIAPTVGCNFACTYCFQEHPTRRMSAENIAAIQKHVADRLDTASGLYVMWFGGEPLLAFDVIRELSAYFTKACAEAGLPFRQSMITNGLLLRDERLEHFCKQDNVNFVQITLDGPPAVHDDRRRRANGGPTFRKIIDNIKAAAGRLPISVRINVDRSNADHLEELVQLLGDEGLRDLISPYLGHVLPYTSVCGEVEQVAFTNEEFAELEANFQLMLFEGGFRPSVGLPKPRFGNFCVADHPQGGVLAPDNLVFRCWNETTAPPEQASGRLCGGSVEASEVQTSNRARWDEYDPHGFEACQACIVQPLCQGGCPWEARKNPVSGPGHCTPLRYNLPDRLRLYHMMRTIDSHPADEDDQPIPTAELGSPCS